MCPLFIQQTVVIINWCGVRRHTKIELVLVAVSYFTQIWLSCQTKFKESWFCGRFILIDFAINDTGASHFFRLLCNIKTFRRTVFVCHKNICNQFQIQRKRSENIFLSVTSPYQSKAHFTFCKKNNVFILFLLVSQWMTQKRDLMTTIRKVSN